MSPTLVERAATAALDCFYNLPEKCKPRTHPDGRREWTPMSAILLAREDEVTCVSLATGTKCLAASAIPNCHGTVLHDSHAEVLALRGFNRWILDEIGRCQDEPDKESIYVQASDLSTEFPNIQQTSQKPFMLKEGVSLHMFTTEAPCGDASMELLIGSKKPEDAAPWPSTVQANSEDSSDLLGRGYFSELGRVRRKPARADAEPSLSKSCTDKLALKQYTGLLSFPSDLLVHSMENTFLKTLIVYADQYNETGYVRAFGESGRLFSKERAAKHFEIGILPHAFPRFRFEKSRDPDLPSKASNISIVWIPGREGHADATHEVLINGVKQGFKQFDDREAKESMVCRKQLWIKAREILISKSFHRRMGLKTAYFATHDILTNPHIEGIPSSNYGDVKMSILRAERRKRKAQAIQQLGAWHSNSNDNNWGL